jgi:hypothetical protein
MKITDSPHRPGTPEHDQWVRRVFIPTVAPERMITDGAKYGAESLGVKRINGYNADLYDRLVAQAKAIGSAFRALGDAAHDAAQSFHATVTVHFPDWLRDYLGDDELQRICREDHLEDAHAWSYYQLTKTPSRAVRRDRQLDHKPLLTPQPECPRHGGPAYKCRPCLRSSHARR